MVFCRLLILAVSSLALAAAPARGQDVPCEQRVKELEEKLRQSENRLKDLARENDRLRKQLNELGPGGKDTKPRKDDKPADPLSSPDALLKALTKDFEEKIASLPHESKPEQTRFIGAAKKWAMDASREFRGPVEWLVKIEKIEGGGGAASPKPADVTFQVLDAAGKPVGKPATQPVPGRFIKALSEGVGSKQFKLTGTFGAKPVHNPSRPEKGSTDDPPFIGPYTEFGCDLAVQNIVEAK